MGELIDLERERQLRARTRERRDQALRDAERQQQVGAGQQPATPPGQDGKSG